MNVNMNYSLIMIWNVSYLLLFIITLLLNSFVERVGLEHCLVYDNYLIIPKQEAHFFPRFKCFLNVVRQILLILASIVAITVYRLAAFFAFSARLQTQDLKELEPLKEYMTPQMATSVTASLISFVVIMILNTLYERVAIWITNFGEFQLFLCPLWLTLTLILKMSYLTHYNRAPADQDRLWEQLDPEDVPLSVRQLLLLLFLHRLLQRKSSWLSRRPHLCPGKVP